jgi:hypothetical protein
VNLFSKPRRGRARHSSSPEAVVRGRRERRRLVIEHEQGSPERYGRTLDDADVIVVRHGASGAADYIAKRTRASVINAGDGLHQHPTQALLDLSPSRRQGRIEGLIVAICGDILHSRVAARMPSF